MLSPVQGISQSSGAVINLEDGRNNNAQSDYSSKNTSVRATTLSGGDLFLQSEPTIKESSSTKTETKSALDFSGISKKIKESLKDDNLSVEFSMDKDSKQMVLKIVNDETKETVRQFPPEVSLKIARMINEQLHTGKVADATV